MNFNIEPNLMSHINLVQKEQKSDKSDLLNYKSPTTQKTILVVGGAGFIGSQVNLLLNERGYKTVVFDDLSRGKEETVIKGSFVKGTLASKDDLNNLFKEHRFDAVMHFAALTAVGESFKNPGAYFINNVTNTKNLLDTMVENKVKHFIFSSSAAIFGNPINDLIDENHQTKPINPYGATKLLVEQMLRNEYSNETIDECLKHFDKVDVGTKEIIRSTMLSSYADKIQSCCFRYFNAAGGDPSGQIKYYERPENNLIPLVLKTLNHPTDKISVFGTDYGTKDGTCIRDYIHIHDLAEAHLKGMEKIFAGDKSLAYNLGNSNGFSVKEILIATEEATHFEVKVQECARREGDPEILIADSKKAYEELGWIPKYTTPKEMITHAWKAMGGESLV